MRSRGMRSPDEWDAVALTFAAPVKEARKREPLVEHRRYVEASGSPGLGWLAGFMSQVAKLRPIEFPMRGYGSV